MPKKWIVFWGWFLVVLGLVAIPINLFGLSVVSKRQESLIYLYSLKRGEQVISLFNFYFIRSLVTAWCLTSLTSLRTIVGGTG